ncbi:MAG: hydrolase [Nitrososphaerales archaeon]
MSAPSLVTDKAKTALVVIDLQKGIASFPAAPHDSKTVVSNAARLADAFRGNKMPVFLVHVVSSEAERLNPISDEQFQRRGPPAKDWAEFMPELGPKEGDIIITKKQWGAFYGTDLDLQMRRRKLDTIVLCGIATNYGVESTARFAYEYGYQQIFAEDAMASMSAEAHNASINYALKRMGRVRSTEQILEAMK